VPGSIDHAIEVFVHGFSFTRSFTHPYLAQRIGPVWVMRDGPRTSADVRNEEWIAHGVEPAEGDRVVRKQARGRFAVCAIQAVNDPEALMRESYKALGYRLGHTEPLMIHRLKRIPRPACPARIERVTTLEMATRLAKQAGSRQVLPTHLNDPAALIRQYVALIEIEPVGWVRSIVVVNATWCSNMYVAPEHRRQGIGRALLGRMRKDDRASGANIAVLLASHVGVKLYAAVGYEQIATLFLWTPLKRGK